MQDQDTERKPKKKVGFWAWLRYGKGTVAEPWPTMDEVLKDDDVKVEIQGVEAAFNAYKKSRGSR